LISSILFHPALALAAIAYVFTVWVWPRRDDWSSKKSLSVGEMVLLFVVLAAFSVEAWRVFHHLQIFQQHMAYQAARKASREYWMLWLKPQAMLLISELGLLTVWCGMSERKAVYAEREILPVMAVAIGMQLYAVLGGEATYDVYSLSIGPALFISSSYRIYNSWFSSRHARPLEVANSQTG
jgi:hypothetical protein